MRSWRPTRSSSTPARLRQKLPTICSDAPHLPSLPMRSISRVLGAVPGYAVHMPGGQFKAPTLSLSGDKAAEYFQDVLAGKLFLATAGVALDSGLTLPSFADLQLKQAMIRAASHVYLVATRQKSIDRRSPGSALWMSFSPSSPMAASVMLTPGPSKAANQGHYRRLTL